MIRKLESSEHRRSWRLLLAVAVLVLAVQPSHGDDEKPNPSEVAASIQVIRQWEHQFRNLEFAYTWEVIALPSRKQVVQETWRVIRQGEWVHISASKSEQDGAIPALTLQQAYDGTITRLAQHDTSGKYSHGRLTFGKALPEGIHTSPLTLGFRNDGFRDDLKLSNYFDPLSPVKPRIAHKVVWQGREMINGLRTVKVEDDMGGGKTTIWLAVDRHYIPVKTYAGHPPSSTSLTEVKDWKEVEPGIIVPVQAVQTTFEDKDGQSTPQQQWIFKVSHIAREPHYDLAFFQDIPLTKGLPVTVLKDGKIIQKFVQPETGEMNPPLSDEAPEVAEPARTGAGWLWEGAAIGLVFVACLGIIYCIGKFWFQRSAR